MDHIADFLNEVHRQLDMPVRQKLRVERELLGHYRDILQDLRASGVEEAQAEREAVSRLGDPAEIAARLNPVYNSASWQSAFLCAFPFFAWALCLMMPGHAARLAVGALLGGIVLFGSVRELVLHRRPVWLTTWLAMSYVGIGQLAQAIWPDPHGHPGFGPTGSALAALAFVFMTTVVWSSPAWRWQGIGFSLLYLAAGALQGKLDLPPMLYLICVLSVLAGGIGSAQILGMRLFADSRDGNASRASLFLLAFYASLILWPAYPLSLGLIAVAFVAVGIAVIAFARAVQWYEKSAALVVGLVLKIALLDWVNNAGYNALTKQPDFEPSGYLVTILIFGAIYIGFSLMPMLAGHANSRGRRVVASQADTGGLNGLSR